MRVLALMIAVAACKHGGERIVEHDRHAVAITVDVQLPGASATTMASAVATPLERQFGQIAKLDRLESRSTLGASEITLEFAAGQDFDSAEMSVQAAINAASNLLPRTLPAPPIYSKVGHDGAVMRMTLSGDMSGFAVANAANTIAQKLSQVSGVGRVRVCGGVDDGWQIRVDPVMLAGTGKTIEDVVAELRQPTVDLDHLETLPITRDVAEVRRSGVIATCQAFGTTGPVDVVTVQPQPGAEIEQVRGNLEALMPSLEAALPPAIKVEVMPRTRPLAFQLHLEPELTDAHRREVLHQILDQLPREAMHPLVELGARDPDTAELRVVPGSDSVESTIVQRISMIPGVRLRDRRDHVVGLTGADPVALRAEIDKLAAALATDKQLHVVETLGTRTTLDRNIKVDRDLMARLGVTADSFDQTLYAISGSMRAFTHTDMIPITLSLRGDPVDVLSQVYVRSVSGTTVPLSTFVSFTQTTEPVEILHEGQFLWLGIRVSGSLDELQAALAKSPSPADMRREIREPD